MAIKSRDGRSGEAYLLKSAVKAMGRRRRHSSISQAMSIGLAALALGAVPASAVTNGTSSVADRSVGSGMAPLPLSQTIVVAARDASRDLLEALTAIRDKNALVLRLTLKDAVEHLGRAGAAPGIVMVEAQIRLVQRDLLERSRDPDVRLWSALQTDIQRYLSDDSNIDRAWVMRTFSAADIAAKRGDREEAARRLEALLSAVARRFDVFPLNLAYEDLSSALETAQSPVPLWDGTKAGIDSAMAQLQWLSQSRAIPLLQAYYSAIEAVAACSNDQNSARQLLLEATRALAEEAPPLATEAETLLSKPVLEAAELADLAAAIRRTIEQARRRDANAFSAEPG